VIAWLAARASHRGDWYEEAVRDGEAIHAHFGRCVGKPKRPFAILRHTLGKLCRAGPV
jgi:hypothetical protein